MEFVHLGGQNNVSWWRKAQNLWYCLCQGATSVAPKSSGKNWALAPAMARPKRNASLQGILRSERIFFTTAKTCMTRCLLQTERNALLFIDVLRCYVAAGKFQLHDFVVMPNHIHLLIEVDQATTIEKAMQLIKGRFSYRVKRECGYGEEM
jgi:REP-associated tyrosine transposase